MNLIEKIQQTASRNFSAPAFIHKDRVLTYRDFLDLLAAATRVMHQKGIRPGDVVGLSLDQSPFHIIVMLALGRLGAISIPVHPLLPLPQKAKLVAKYGIRAIVSNSDKNRVAGADFIKLDTLSANRDAKVVRLPDFVASAETPFRISLSSGTTGDSKGVLLTHGNLLDRIEKTLYDCDGNSSVMPFDLNFALGFVFAIGALTIGGTVVFPHSRKRIETINLHAVTHIFLSPIKLMRMAALLPDGRGIAFPTLKHLRIVGDTPSSALLEVLRTKFSPNIFVPYGLTELGAISIATPDILATWPNSSGRIQAHTHVEIMDDAGQILEPGKPGEIRVKVDGMPTEYYKNEEQTRLKFRDGWFYTGDIGHISEEGLLFIEGRKDDVINLDGHKLNPKHVEEILAQHPDVSEAVAFAVTNSHGEQFLAAAIIPRAGKVHQDDLTKHARQQLGLFYPKHFFVMRDFPRNSNGKILRGKVSATALKML